MTVAENLDPASRFGESWERLFDPPLAHRGLWNRDGAPENSLAAFQAACSHGYGIELDVQLSADGEAMVFHDSKLTRMTGAEGRLSDHTATDLGTLKLAGTDETIPTLSDTLTLIGHRAMVLIDHNGPTAIIGFNPYSHAWFAAHHPQILRGLNSYAYSDDNAHTMAAEQRKAYSRLEHVGMAKPHFLALGLDLLPSPAATKLRDGGMPIVAWTVRSPDQWDKARDHSDNLIFEGFAA